MTPSQVWFDNRWWASSTQDSVKSTWNIIISQVAVIRRLYCNTYIFNTWSQHRRTNMLSFCSFLFFFWGSFFPSDYANFWLSSTHWMRSYPLTPNRQSWASLRGGRGRRKHEEFFKFIKNIKSRRRKRNPKIQLNLIQSAEPHKLFLPLSTYRITPFFIT